jgi:hypothetical protein
MRTNPRNKNNATETSECPYCYWRENGKYCNFGDYKFFMKFSFLDPGYKLSVAWRFVHDL